MRTHLRDANATHIIERMGRDNYIKVVEPKLTERGIMAKHWPGNWSEEISFSNFALLRVIAALAVDSVWPPNLDEIATSSGIHIHEVKLGVTQLMAQGMLHDGPFERGFVLTPNGIRLVTDVTVYERYRPDAPRVPTS